MARYEVQDGTGKKYIIEGPEDATPEEIEAFAEQQFSVAAQKESVPDFGGPTEQYLRGLASEVMNTGTYIGDKVAGAGRMAGQWVKDQMEGTDSDLYEAYQYPQKLRKQFAQENPKAATTASIAGAIANPINRHIGGWAVKNPSLGNMMWRGAQAGGAMSGLQALGEYIPQEKELIAGAVDNVLNAVPHAASGAAFGAAIPPAIAKGGKLVQSLYRGMVDRLPYRQNTVALRKLAEAMNRDELTPGQAFEKVSGMGDEAMIADAGPNVRTLANMVYNRPGKGKKILSDALTKRQEGVRGPDNVLRGSQSQRVMKSIDDLVPEDYHATKQGIANENKAAQFYDEAYGANKIIESPEIDRILKTPSGKQALREAVRMMRDDMKNVSQVDPALTEMLKETGGKATGGGVGRGLKLETLDYVKRAFRKIEERATNKFGKATDHSRIITARRKELTRLLDKVDETGAYKQARGLASDKFANQEAIESGFNFMTKKAGDPVELKTAFKEMSAAEKHYYRIGAAQAIKAKLEGLVVRADATKQIMDIPALEQKIKIAFDDEAMFRRYINNLNNEKEMFKTYAKVLKGSETAERDAAMRDYGIDPGALLQLGINAKTSNVPGVLQSGLNMISGMKNRAMIPESASGQLGKLLTGKTAPGLNRTYQDILQADMAKKLALEGILIGESSMIGRQ